MAPLGSTPPTPATAVNGSSETYSRLNIGPIIAIYSVFSILLGIMFYISLLNILRHVWPRLLCNRDVEKEAGMSLDGKSSISRL
jgi:hypothetical protein